MALDKIKTKSIGTQWVMEVYPFDSPVPEAGQLDKTSGPSLVIGAASAIKSVTQKINDIKNKAGGSQPSGETKNSHGIISIVYDRSKKTSDGQCVVTIVGQLPEDVHIGAWAIISSISNDASGKETTLTRYVGQILSIDCSYQMLGEGLLAQNNVVTLREWSSIFQVPIRYDIFSIEAGVASSAKLTDLATKAMNSLGKGGSSYEEITKLLENSFDPYEFAELVLMLLGMLNQEDATRNLKIDGKEISYPAKAINAPGLPKGIQERLGINTSGTPDGVYWPGMNTAKSNPLNPFASGFMQTVVGIQTKPVNNDGKWNGIFEKISIKDMKDIMKKGLEANDVRPRTDGVAILFQSGISAWEALTRFCDNAINEIYTDIWYERGDEESDIVARPVVVVRNQPFLLKKVLSGQIAQQPTTDLSGWALYDDLPRVHIPDECIMQFRITNTFLNSPNYIRVNVSLLGVNDKNNDALAALSGITRLDSEMNRFGGNECFVNTSFMARALKDEKANNKDENFFTKWFETIRELKKAWHSYDYRMGSGVLAIKDSNVPFSVGFNVQFKIGKYTLVGHIESVNSTFTIDSNGTGNTMTTLSLSKIVQVREDGELDFIDLRHFGSLPFKTPSLETDNSSIGGSIGKAKDIANFGKAAAKFLT